MSRGRPKTKVNTKSKILDPKIKVRLDARTIVYVRSMEILESIWLPMYPDLEILETAE